MEIPDNYLRSIQTFFNFKLNEIYTSHEILSLFRMSAQWINGFSLLHIHFYPEQRVNQSELIRYEQIVLRLLKGEPIQYIMGYTWFMDLKILVNNDVLIPRPETEELVNHALELLSHSNPKIWDICTGSGCIALALKHYLPEALVEASDISNGAIKCAKQNAQELGLDIHFYQHDIQDEAKYEADSLDLIISNPPYIPLGEKSEIASNVKDYEPSIALFVDDTNPLFFYSLIRDKALNHLKPGGIILLECHFKYAFEVEKLFQTNDFEQVHIHHDLSGNPRVLSALKR